MKEVLLCNNCGFALSPKAIKFIYDRKGWKPYPEFCLRGLPLKYISLEEAIELNRQLVYFPVLYDRLGETDNEDNEFPRDDADVIAAVREFKSEAFCGGRVIEDFRIAQIPDDIDWYVAVNDETCYEWVAQKHKIWKGEKII